MCCVVISLSPPVAQVLTGDFSIARYIARESKSQVTPDPQQTHN